MSIVTVASSAVGPLAFIAIPCQAGDGNLERQASGGWKHTDADHRCDTESPDEDRLRDELHDELRDLPTLPLWDVDGHRAAWARIDALAETLAEIDGRVTASEVIAAAI